MGTLYERMAKFFQTDGWPCQADGDSTLQTSCRGENGRWFCRARAQEDPARFVMYSMFPIRIPAPKRVRVAEYLLRANYGLVIGNFELDLDEGELRFRTSLDIKDAAFTSELLKPLVYTNVRMMDRYLPGLMAVLYDEVTPKAALRLVEADDAAA